MTLTPSSALAKPCCRQTALHRLTSASLFKTAMVSPGRKRYSSGAGAASTVGTAGVGTGTQAPRATKAMTSSVLCMSAASAEAGGQGGAAAVDPGHDGGLLGGSEAHLRCRIADGEFEIAGRPLLQLALARDLPDRQHRSIRSDEVEGVGDRGRGRKRGVGAAGMGLHDSDAD